MAAWGLITFLKAAEQQIDASGWFLGLIALGLSFPVALVITFILNRFRSSIAGTVYERRLEKAKGMRIGTVSAIVGFIGFAEAVAFGSGVGQVVFFIAWIGVMIGMGVHFYEMFRGSDA